MFFYTKTCNGPISGEWVVQAMVEDTKEYFFYTNFKPTHSCKIFLMIFGVICQNKDWFSNSFSIIYSAYILTENTCLMKFNQHMFSGLDAKATCNKHCLKTFFLSSGYHKIDILQHKHYITFFVLPCK